LAEALEWHLFHETGYVAVEAGDQIVHAILYIRAQKAVARSHSVVVVASGPSGPATPFWSRLYRNQGVLATLDTVEDLADRAESRPCRTPGCRWSFRCGPARRRASEIL